MDLFEFILIITSVIYALALAQVLSGIGRLAQTEGTIRWFLPHTLWVVILFLFILLMWWAGWEFRAVEWTFQKFAYNVIAPTLIFFSSSLVIPQRAEEQDVDLERHFFKIRRPFLWSFSLAYLAVLVDGPLLVSEPLWFPGRIPQVALLCGVLGGLFTENRRLQTSLSVAVLLVTAYIIVTRLSIPR